MTLFGRRTTLVSIGTVGLLTGLAYLTSIARDAILAAYYGGSAALDIYFIALSPSQFLGMEIASLSYLAFLPEFSRFIGVGDKSRLSRLLHERVAFTIKGSLGVAVLLTITGVLLTPVIAPGYASSTLLRSVRISFA